MKIHLIKTRFSHADAVSGEPFRKYREERMVKNGNTRDQQDQVVEQKARFAGNNRVELVLTLQVITVLEICSDAHQQDDSHEPNEPAADLCICERMHPADHSAARQEWPEDTQQALD